jgi:xanthine dehydrogenase accessory factor
MTETQSIVEAYRRAAAENVRAALATVVRLEGSAYRRPGARMLITEDGLTTGVVSGGCLEGDVRERAARVMRTGQPMLVTYDTMTDEDVVWGLGMGCNGIVDVFIEPASKHTDRLMQFLALCSTSRRRAAFATVIQCEGVADLTASTRVFHSPDGEVDADAADPNSSTVQCIRADLERAIRGGTSMVAEYASRGRLNAFIEVVEPPVSLFIFGAGADAVPLVTTAQQLGWHATIVDTHARTRSLERFRAADGVILCTPQEIPAHVALADSSVAVVMTHNYFHDREILNVLLRQPLRYVGCLGPKRRTDRILSELGGAFGPAEKARVERLHAPIGADIGAETSSEIALSIAAEILAVLRERSGAPLRSREGAIHDTPVVVADDWRRRIADAPRIPTAVSHAVGA